MLFDKLHKKPEPKTPEVNELFDRLQSMRRQVGYRDVPLTDLFGLVGHDESRMRRPLVEPAQEKAIQRVHPDEVPTLYPVSDSRWEWSAHKPAKQP
jgi:hypothetical protein